MASAEQTFWAKVRAITRGKDNKITLNPITIWQNSQIAFGAKGLQGFTVDNIMNNDPLRVMRDGASKKISPDRAMQKINGWVFAAINAIASEISCIDFELYEINGENHEHKDQHEALDILDGVNPFMTGPELKWTTAMHLEATGNAYWLLHGVEDAKSKPDMIYIMNPAQIKVELDKTEWPYTIKRYKYTIDDRDYYFQPWEVLHFKYPDPNDPYEGIGTIQSIAPWIDNDNYAMEYNRQFFLGGAHMDGVFETEYTTEEQVAAMKIAFESSHQGVENAHKTGFLPKGVHWKSTQASAKDMDLKNLLEMTRDFILAAFRVGKTILGTAESDTNRATAETADYVFAKRTIKPKMALICSYLNEFYVPRFGDNLYISFKDPTPEDKAFRVTEMQAAVGSQPVISTNEARREFMGLGPVDGGDVVKIGAAMADLGAPQEETPEKPAGAPKATTKAINNGKRVIKTRAAKTAEVRNEMSKKMTDSVAEKLAKITAMRKKSFFQMSKEEHYILWKDFGTRINKIEPEIKKIIQGINTAQKKEVMGNIKDIFSKAYQIKAGLPDLFNLKNWIKITIDAATPAMAEFYANEGKIASVGVGAEAINIMDTEAGKTALERAVQLFAQSYNQTTMDQLKEKLGEALASGQGVAHAADLVSGIYDFADSTRATAVAKTELFRIGNEASKQAWAQAGVSEMKWQAYDDALECEFCKEMEDTVAAIDDNFLSQGDNFTGADGGVMSADYSDVSTPPLHPNCRCSLVPVDPNL